MHTPEVDSREPTCFMCTWLKSFFYAHNSKSNEKNILILELALFHLKCDVSAKQLTIIDFFVKKKVIWTQVIFK
jgi:hypothetical protein